MPIVDSAGRVHYVVQEAPPTAATVMQYEGVIRAIRENFPQLLEAKQPPPLPKGVHTPVSSPALRERFHKTVTERIANNIYRLRAPAMNGELAGMLQMQTRGDCIAPAVCHGDTTWIDPNMEPQEGDIVSILLHPASGQYNLNWRLQHPEHVKTYGTEACATVKKVLMAVGSTWYGVAANGSCFELGERTGNRILGVVRRVVRPGTITYTDGRTVRGSMRLFEPDSLPMYAAPPPAAMVAHATAGPAFGPIAAAARPPDSEVHSTTVSAVSITQLFTTPSEAIQSVAELAINAPLACSLEVSVTVNFSHNMSDPVFESAAYDIVLVGVTSPSYKYVHSARSSSTTQDTFTAVATFSVAAGSHTVRFGMAKLSSGTTLTVDTAHLRVIEVRPYP